YLSESAFPVYVLHQAAIVLPGYFLIRLPLGIGAKFVLLLLLSVSLTLAAYQWLVRPFAVPRFLLGMKPKAWSVPRRPVPVSRSAADGSRSHGPPPRSYSPELASHLPPGVRRRLQSASGMRRAVPRRLHRAVRKRTVWAGRMAPLPV